MTKDVESELRIDLVKSTGDKGHAKHQSFSISRPSNYTLHIGTYSGTAGNMIMNYFKNLLFSFGNGRKKCRIYIKFYIPDRSKAIRLLWF